MSSSMALRRSPKPGALTAATLRPPRRRLTTSVARASPSMSSAMISSGRCDCTTASRIGSMACRFESFFSCSRITGSSSTAIIFSALVTKYGDEVAAVELHALDDVEFGLGGLGFLDGDDTLVADLLHGVGDHLADRGFAVGRNGADLGDFGVRRNGLLGLAEVLDDFGHGQIDAALQIHRVHAGGNELDAFVDDGLAEHGRGGGAVTGDVVGLGSHGAQHLGAHVLELVFEFDFLGDGDAVLGDARGAERLVDHDVAALRTERDLHRIGEDVDAADHLVAGIGGELYVFSSHVRRSLRWSGKSRCEREALTADHAHDVGFLHDQQVLAVELDLGAAPLAEQDAVADLDVERRRSCRSRRGRRGRRTRSRPRRAFPWRCRG